MQLDRLVCSFDEHAHQQNTVDIIPNTTCFPFYQCFMNSCVQALLSTAPVRALLRRPNLEASFQQILPPISDDNDDGDDTETTSRHELVSAMRDILNASFCGRISSGRRRGGTCVTVRRDLLLRVKQYLDNWSQFRGWNQHDPQEALALLMEGMDKALSYHPINSSTASAMVSAMNVANENLDEYALRYDNESSRMEASPIRDLFEIKQVHKRTCSNCGRVTSTGETLLMLNLEIPSNATSVGECLSNAFKEELLEDYKCDGCGVQDRCSKTPLMCRSSPLLAIQLKRFAVVDESSSQKITRLIRFPLTGIDISQYVMSGGQDAVYDVYAVMNHTGNIGSGHCFTHAMGRDGRWFVYDDEKEVEQISTSKVVTNDAYVILARRRGVPSGIVVSPVEEKDGDEVEVMDESPEPEVSRRTDAEADDEDHPATEVDDGKRPADDSSHEKLKATLATKFPSNAGADRELRWLRREILSADEEVKAKYRPQLLALVEIIQDRSETEWAGGIDDEEKVSDDEYVEGSTGRGSKLGRASSKRSSGGRSKAGVSGKKIYRANRKLNSKGEPLKNDNANFCGGAHVYNVNDNDTVTAKAVPVITDVQDQRKAMSDNLAVCSGIEKRTAKLLDDATDNLRYKQAQKDVGQGQAQHRGSACLTHHGNDLGGTRSTDHSTKAKKSIDEFLNSMKQFLIKHGVDPGDEGLVEAHSILFQRGGGMGWHPDAAKNDCPHLHFVRFVFSRGGSGAIDFASHFFEAGDGRASKKDPNHPSSITVATTEGHHLYAMSPQMSGMSALCWTNDNKSRGIQQQHRVNTIPLDGNQRANIIITAPFRRWEDVEKVLATINGKLFSLFPASTQLEAADRAKRAAVDAVNRKDVVLCESDKVYDCEHCSNGQAVTALRPKSGGGERGSCPPTICGKCVTEQVESSESTYSDYIPTERYPMDCQCGRDSMGNSTCCRIHFGEEKKCHGCKQKGCYGSLHWCLDCVNKHIPGKGKRCRDCNEMGCYKMHSLCKGCLGIGICGKCGEDKEAGNFKYCNACEPLCKAQGCTNERRSHVKSRTNSQHCFEHRGKKGASRKPCAKCGGDKGKGNNGKWCPSCSNKCKICDAVLTAERKKLTGGHDDYCSNKHRVAAKKKRSKS